MPNRLAAERSPYLLQHADNPVDWYPWGEEAFARARAEDRPIFLSIGYATCHWCHVMEHESFENETIARALNDSFVSIKVDREERPDVDRVYMTFVQATTGAGGWPMSVFLTPELKPFFGGTYFPPDSRWGRPGFGDVLREIALAWRAERPRVDTIAQTLTERLREATSGEGRRTGDIPDESLLVEGVETFRRTFDARHGGFGSAPKFPRPSELLFLLREHARAAPSGALEMAAETLRAMAFGGMRDHVGGGFHRYSVDREWRVPHFEKMLYDQAQLVLAFLEAAQATGDQFYAVVAEDTLDYVRRDMTGDHGGFYSAEDADSVPPESSADPLAPRSEGAFYLWTREEIVALFGDRAGVVTERFGILPEGNAPEDPHGEFTGKNILHTAASIEEVARRTGRTPDQVVEILGDARPAMFYARSGRPRPFLDDKVLTAWNGLMIAAFARAGRTLVTSGRAASYLETAARAARFVRERLWHADRRVLLRRYRDGETAIDGYCEDYACLIWGLLELVQATGDADSLEWAIALQARQDELFWDGQDDGWFTTTGADPTVLLRLKEDYDGAEPSPISVGAQNALWLAHLTGKDEYRQRAAHALGRVRERGSDAARIAPFACAVLSTWHAGIGQAVIVGEAGREETARLHAVLAQRYLPFTIVIPIAPGQGQQHLARLLPFTADMLMADGRATAYICRDFTCEMPARDAGALASQLDRGRVVE
jgi:uncharacterized protein YyaL (SSP411 family)